MSKISVLTVAFLIGFSSLLYQTYAIHIVFQFFPKGSDIVSLSIASFLAGLGLSALFFTKVTSNESDRAKAILMGLQLALVFFTFVFYWNIEVFELAIQYIETHIISPDWVYLSGFLLIWMYLFVPAFMLGAGLPIVIALNQSDHKKRFDQIGIVYFIDILGSVLGSVITGFYLIPYLGLETTIAAAVLCSFLTCVFLFEMKIVKKPAVIMIAFLIPLSGFFVLTHDLNKQTMEAAEAVPLDQQKAYGDILFEEPSRFGTVRVRSNYKNLRLFIDYRTMCLVPLINKDRFQGDAEDLLARITMANLKSDAKILGIGLGCGITAGYIADDAKTKDFTLVEINPSVINAYKAHFAENNINILTKENTRLIIDDGAKYLRLTNEQYDSIVIDIEEPDIIHSSPLFTLNYFKIAKSKLKQDGILSVWSFYVNPDFNKVLHNTLNEVFEYVYFLPRANSRGAVYFGSDKPINTGKVFNPNLKKYDNINHAIDSRKYTLVLEHDNNEINTILKPTLTKYYSSKEFFDFSKQR